MEKTARKYSTALVVGRFQPFHLGHLFLLQEALKLAETLVIAIGSAGSPDLQNNPLTYPVRRRLLQEVLEREELADRVTKVIALPDFPSDEEWRDTLIEKVGEFSVVVGNNEWTNSVLAAAGYAVQTVPLAERAEWQGAVIRQRIQDGQAWQHTVPEYLVENIQKEMS